MTWTTYCFNLVLIFWTLLFWSFRFIWLCLKSLTCCFVFSWCSGGVLLISVQGIAVNVDPVFCTWLLYQPHRGSSRQQQQVSNPVSCFHRSLSGFVFLFVFFCWHLILIQGNTSIMYGCRTFPTNLHPPPTKKHKNIKLPLVSLSQLPFAYGLLPVFHPVTLYLFDRGHGDGYGHWMQCAHTTYTRAYAQYDCLRYRPGSPGHINI